MPRPSLGKYEVLARLATGGSANIFLARELRAQNTPRLVCLKVLLPERAEDAEFVAMFLDEARLAARLSHQACVKIHALGRQRGVHYISMEYIFGETLWSLLTTVTRLKEPLPTAHVASIVASACDGLHHAHELTDSSGRPYNLVHRDVSPQNVMITYEGETKVLDFGIAKAETGRAPTEAGIVKGKFGYMSPEQISGGTVDRRSDVYSMAIVLFECLASRRLYRGDTPEDVARLILEHRAPRLREVLPDIPPALDDICAKALARNPSKRFQSALEFKEALRNHLEEIHFAPGPPEVARLMEERFRGVTDQRRLVYASALRGQCDESRLLAVLDARAVRDLDLFSEKGSTEPDYLEEFREGPFLDIAEPPRLDVELPNPEDAEPTRIDPEPYARRRGRAETGTAAGPGLWSDSGAARPLLEVELASNSAVPMKLELDRHRPSDGARLRRVGDPNPAAHPRSRGAPADGARGAPSSKRELPRSRQRYSAGALWAMLGLGLTIGLALGGVLGLSLAGAFGQASRVVGVSAP